MKKEDLRKILIALNQIDGFEYGDIIIKIHQSVPILVQKAEYKEKPVKIKL